MTESEDATTGTTVAHTKTCTKFDKVQKSTSSVQEGHGDRNNARNNTKTPRQALNNIKRVKVRRLKL